MITFGTYTKLYYTNQKPPQHNLPKIDSQVGVFGKPIMVLHRKLWQLYHQNQQRQSNKRQRLFRQRQHQHQH